MDETVIVIMLKNKGTGFLERELGSYSVEFHENLIYNIFALEENAKTTVYMRLTTERDLEEWEFPAVLDYYDTDSLLEVCNLAEEDDSGYNPIWEAAFDFSENQEIMEERISRILDIHKEELSSVYNAIKDLKNDYEV
ncbi:MAG: hypothetical protein FWE24_01975 [Defluviitaleaceae bacterium]|nr:hypothetical protein [Defluviitaleaceae bacterium]